MPELAVKVSCLIPTFLQLYALSYYVFFFVYAVHNDQHYQEIFKASFGTKESEHDKLITGIVTPVTFS